MLRFVQFQLWGETCNAMQYNNDCEKYKQMFLKSLYDFDTYILR